MTVSTTTNAAVDALSHSLEELRDQADRLGDELTEAEEARDQAVAALREREAQLEATRGRVTDNDEAQSQIRAVLAMITGGKP